MCRLAGRSFPSLVFFFQAEDGIRDGRVTGVQTCALPIFRQVLQHQVRQGHVAAEGPDEEAEAAAQAAEAAATSAEGSRGRSEERRVGKECRSRRSPYH